MTTFHAADLFCGAGGASTGLMRAAERLGLPVELLAVNHWPTAVATHSLNHPGVKHLCEEVDRINPREAVPGGRLHLLLAGPECTHHSSASGGRPKNEQSRASAWHILKWCQELYIDNVLIENVPEFKTWGPLGVNGLPLKSRKGQTYAAFLMALRSLGYRVEDRILNAADYGDPTTRQRLFILAQRSPRRVSFPVATHSRGGGRSLFGTTKKWRAAREVIDWTLPGQSIFGRKKALAPATLARILAGLEKFGGPELRPFLVVLRNHAGGRSLDAPLPTLTATGTHVGLCEPFVLSQQSGGAPRPTNSPLPTVACDGAIQLVQPFLVPYHSPKTAAETPRVNSVDDPLPTLSTENRFAVVEPVLMHTTHGGRAHDINQPVPTVTGAHRGELAVVEPFIVPQRRFDSEQAKVDSVEDPLRTITAAGGRCFGLAQPFLTKYNGTARDRAFSVEDPLDTVSTRDRFGLVQPTVNGLTLDIRFRMLQPHELAAATSFPKSYVFTGNRGDVVKQIGNAWPGETALALCSEVLAPYASQKQVAAWRKERIA
jgi:DNA (cytosine-5)-methyltransferase 1